MLILTDPTTLSHKTVELLGSRLMPALESPERITIILAALEQTQHSVRQLNIEEHPEAVGEGSLLLDLLSNSHDSDYLHHLKTAHAAWIEQGLLEPTDTILPECFPSHRLSRNRTIAARLAEPPKDIFARAGFYAFDMSAGICKDTWKAALASANLAVEAARFAAGHEASSNGAVGVVGVGDDHAAAPTSSSLTAFALCRPPGHHCTTSMAGGYCYINNAVIAVLAMQRLHKRRSAAASPNIAILDIDFHHGNGTQEYFYSDPSVLYVSIHGQDEYPYFTGHVDEKGEGKGEGFNLNLPLPAGSTAEAYLELLETALRRVEEYRPEYLVVSMGFDTFHLDVLGSFKLESDDYFRIARKITASKIIARLPCVILLEGGYALEQLGENFCQFLTGWESNRPVGSGN
ncbi:Arginase/deacetylase [Microthyrium microscopicum]|uniref:Arginase/deacetylase n=1 Tax=Microthyrium microscopicum TaxID=703497 RepID=A0A6A6TYI0_9PEZI|nr:Arginase/deacetylase [Microthyrium microscopicum]